MPNNRGAAHAVQPVTAHQRRTELMSRLCPEEDGAAYRYLSVVSGRVDPTLTPSGLKSVPKPCFMRNTQIRSIEGNSPWN